MSQLAGLGFGSGFVLASPQSNYGNPAAQPTPLQLGVVQNVKFTLGADIKSLYGQNQWAVDSAIGKRSIKGTLEFAQISNILMSQLFFSDAITPGVVASIVGESGTVPASSVYTVTVAHGGTFAQDFGVTYANTGVPLVNVGGASLTAAGQYKVNTTTGVYTFDAADASAVMLFNYTWTDSATGTTMVAGNHQMGFGPVVTLDIVFPYDAPTPGGMGFYFPNCRLGKIDTTSKLDDYSMFSSDFEAFAGLGTNAGSPFTSYQAF